MFGRGMPTIRSLSGAIKVPPGSGFRGACLRDVPSSKDAAYELTRFAPIRSASRSTSRRSINDITGCQREPAPVRGAPHPRTAS